MPTTLEEREKALAKLLPYQRDDFAGIFRELKGLPATIRTLDPPLHEFLPHEEEAQKDLAAKMGVPVEKIKQRVKELHEFNPMLGLRGCRLGIVYPEITEMQTRAIIEAAAQVQKEGIPVKPEIMIVLVGFPKELQNQLEVVNRVAQRCRRSKRRRSSIMVGTMIEIPRGALAADEIAKDAAVLQLRHERPDPDLPGHEPRRFRPVPAEISGTGDRQAEPVRLD